MLWACITLPELPLEAAFRGYAHDASPYAVFEAIGSRLLIAQADAVALASGIQPGQSVSAARALRPDVQLRARQSDGETSLQQTLAAWAYGFSSQVLCLPASPALPTAIALEVGASLRLFNGWPHLSNLLTAGLQALGHAHGLAAAPTVAGAHLLAAQPSCMGMALFDLPQLRHVLAHLPLTASGLTDETLIALHSLGLRRLGEVFALPRPELARRLGPQLLDDLDRLRGEAPEMHIAWQPPDTFRQRIDFDHGIDNHMALQFAVRRLSTELAAFVFARCSGVQRFTLLFEHEDRPPSRLEIGLRQPLNTPDALFDAARVRLEQTQLPAAVIALGLHADELPPLAPERRDLFDPTPRSALDLSDLIERLRARLGDESICTLHTYPEHRPERAWRIAENTVTDAAGIPFRPHWLLPRPLPLRQRIHRILRGPERIESGWWDDHDVRRDYVIAELESGQHAWLFREIGSDGPWMLHGWFA